MFCELSVCGSIVMKPILLLYLYCQFLLELHESFTPEGVGMIANYFPIKESNERPSRDFDICHMVQKLNDQNIDIHYYLSYVVTLPRLEFSLLVIHSTGTNKPNVISFSLGLRTH